MHQPQRNIGPTLSSGYRYSFNGMEKDDEVKGSGNSYTTEFRQYDPRVGRWLSLDPKASKMPWESPYVSMNNSPIFKYDVFGDSAISTDQKLANYIVEDLNAIYKRTYDLEVDAFSVVEVTFIPEGQSKPVTGYAIVTNDIEGDPDFWEDRSSGDESGYRQALWELLAAPQTITVGYSPTNGGWGSAPSNYWTKEGEGRIYLDSDLGRASETKGTKNELSFGGVFLHEAIYHKSMHVHIIKYQGETAHKMQTYYGLRHSETDNSMHPGGNSLEPGFWDSWHTYYRMKKLYKF